MSPYLSRLAQFARDRPSYPAICDDTRSLGYGELFHRVETGAAALVGEGIGPSSRVGLMIGDELEHLVATLALLYVGAWQITLASHDTADVRAELALRIRATDILTDGLVAGPSSVRALPWTVGRPAHDLRAPSGHGGFFFRTSGTTGSSNIVPVSEAELTHQSVRNPEYAGGRYLRLASVEHNNAKRHRLYNLFLGATNVLRPSRGDDLAAYCRSQVVTSMDMSVMHAVDLAGSGLDRAFEGVGIRVAGSAVPIALRRRLQKRVSSKVFVRYASTESGTIAVCDDHDDDESVGRPVEGIELEIVDDNGRLMPQGELGHVRLRGQGVVTGYHEGPQQTAERFRDGWFWPGDIGYLRGDGSLVLKGRADEMMILNGINIFPSEIERVLETHPSVRTAAATSLKSGVHGDIPVAAVELVEGSETAGDELMMFARERLALRAPRRLLVVPSLPRTGQGKLLRREVAAMIDAKRKQQ